MADTLPPTGTCQRGRGGAQQAQHRACRAAAAPRPLPPWRLPARLRHRAAAVGVWGGISQQNFGLANPSVPGSFECLQNGVVSSRPQTLTISADGAVTASALEQQTFTINGGLYVVPAQPAESWTWAAYNSSSSIVQLRPASSPASIECYYLVATSSTMALVDVGGRAVTDNWALQCSPETYTALPNVLTAPVCVPQTNGTWSPETSTILVTMSNSPSAASGAQSAASLLTAVAVGLVALAGGSLAL